MSGVPHGVRPAARAGARTRAALDFEELRQKEVDPAAYEVVPAALGPAAGAIGAALWAHEGPGP